MTEYFEGEEVFEFITRCPVDGCNNYEEINWNHTGCGKKEYINQYAEIICSVCKKKMRIFDINFNCGKHVEGKPPSKDVQRLVAAFEPLYKHNNGKRHIIKRLLTNLIDICQINLIVINFIECYLSTDLIK